MVLLLVHIPTDRPTPHLPACLVVRVSRPWGRDGEVVYCYGLSLQALLDDRPPFFEGEPYRPALYSRAMEILPPSVFGYDRKALKAAIRSCTHRYGRVAYVEKVRSEGRWW